MLGGKESLIFPTGKLWIFDFETELWKFGGECEYNGKVLALEGHGANVWAHEDVINKNNKIVNGHFWRILY